MTPLAANPAATPAQPTSAWQPPSSPGAAAAGDFASLLFAAQGAAPPSTTTPASTASAAASGGADPDNAAGTGAHLAPAHGTARADDRLPTDDEAAAAEASAPEGDTAGPGLLGWLLQPTLLMPAAAAAPSLPSSAAATGLDALTDASGLAATAAQAEPADGAAPAQGGLADAAASAAMQAWPTDTSANPYIGMVPPGPTGVPGQASNLAAEGSPLAPAAAAVDPGTVVPPAGMASSLGAPAGTPGHGPTMASSLAAMGRQGQDTDLEPTGTPSSDARRALASRGAGSRDRLAAPGGDALTAHARTHAAAGADPKAEDAQAPLTASAISTSMSLIAAEAPAPAAQAVGTAGAPPAVTDPQASASMLASPTTTPGADTGTPSTSMAQARMQLSTPVDSPAFGPALGVQLRTLVRNGIEQAHVELHPADMGPISVRIALDGSGARIDFTADVAATRQALEAALPALAGALREAGLTLTGGGVFQQSPQAQADAQPGSQGNGRPSRDGAAADDGPESAATRGGVMRQVPRGLVDLVA